MWKGCTFEVNSSGIAVLTMNRPNELNAFNDEILGSITKACRTANEDHNVKVLVVTGAGRGFTSGGDLAGLASINSIFDAKEKIDSAATAIKALYEVDKPVIAAVNGPVAGAGLALMMASDLIIASEKAVLGFSFINIAFCSDSGCSFFLTRQVGYHKAAEILLFGKIINSAEALQLGLVNKVVPDGEIMTETMQWAEKLASGPQLTVSINKKLLRQALGNDFYQQCELEGLYQTIISGTEDFRSGVRAALEKRKPVFKS